MFCKAGQCTCSLKNLQLTITNAILAVNSHMTNIYKLQDNNNNDNDNDNVWLLYSTISSRSQCFHITDTVHIK